MKLFYHGCIAIDVHLWIASRSRSFHHGLIPWWGENIVKYIKKVYEKISSLKRGSFSRKHKKVGSNSS
jgi:hypothetical protein